MSMYDFNNADEQRSGFDLIPDGTIVPVQLTVRPGGSGEGAWFKPTNAGDALMLDMEFVVFAGDYAKRKIWQMGIFKGNGTSGHTKAENITRSLLRAMLESAYNLSPTDDSEAAMAKRRINGPEDLDGLRMVAKIGIEKGKPYMKDGVQQPGQDKNKILEMLTPGKDGYAPVDQVRGSVAPSTAAAANGAVQASSGSAPSWAR